MHFVSRLGWSPRARNLCLNLGKHYFKKYLNLSVFTSDRTISNLRYWMVVFTRAPYSATFGCAKQTSSATTISALRWRRFQHQLKKCSLSSGTEKVPQRTCATKILPNFRVNFLMRFASKFLFYWEVPSNCSENSLVMFMRFFGFGRAFFKGGDLNPGERHSRDTRDDGTVTLCTLRAATVLSHACRADFGRPLAKKWWCRTRVTVRVSRHHRGQTLYLSPGCGIPPPSVTPP